MLTVLGGVKTLRARPWIEAGGERSRSGVPSAGTWFIARGWVGAGLEFEV